MAEGDKVVTRYIARGTHRGEFMVASPTGEEVAVTGINIVCLEGGKIVESWGNSGQLGMLRQIGVVQLRSVSEGGPPRMALPGT